MPVDINVTEIASPELEFGGPGTFSDPKVGLVQAGPFDSRFGGGRVRQVRVGLVGPPDVVTRAKRWFERCQDLIRSGMDNEAQYPDYPGFSAAFRADLVLDRAWERRFEGTPNPLSSALYIKQEDVRFERVVQAYVGAIRSLADPDLMPRPDVVVCCIPEELQAYNVRKEVGADARKAAAAIRRDQLAGQLGLFDEIDVEENEEDLLFRDFRRALKSYAMEIGVPIQLGTDHMFLDGDKNQDPATRAWNSTVALYYKAGGIPWRLKSDGPETCFVGISFYHFESTKQRLVRSSIAQAFSSDGDGFALRGESVPWEERQGRRVNLTRDQALRLGQDILREYEDRTGGLPRRIVVHKTSRFNEAERSGFGEAFRSVPVQELINIMPTQFRLVRHGLYPPRRGTLCHVNDDASFLFTTGFMPEIETYPGPHIPAPARLMSDDLIDVERAAADIMGLTRMNWNTASITNGQPVTLSFARKVGGVMSEWLLRNEGEPPSSFRYYM
jgi:hypothetical protein